MWSFFFLVSLFNSFRSQTKTHEVGGIRAGVHGERVIVTWKAKQGEIEMDRGPVWGPLSDM